MITKAKEPTNKLERNAREPEWLTDSRRQAWKLYEGIPVPTLKDELWRHTDLSKIDLSRFSSNDVGARSTKSVKETVSNEAKDLGVVVMDLASAGLEHPELVRKHLETLQTKLFNQDKFFTLNAALFDESVFVYVPPNVKLTDPLTFAFELSSTDGAAFPKLIVVADQGSEFKLINALSSSKNSFVAGAIQLLIGSNANVSYLEIQNFKEGSTSITRTVNQISKDARFNSLTVAAGGSIVRSDILTELKGAGAEVKLLGIVLGSDNEHYDFNTIIDHQVPNTTSNINFRVALKDSASSLYQGTIRVDKEAQQTVAYQSNKNLLLSDKAHAASIPKLEILANDVKCSHGATIAAVDKDQVFYLCSRGLNTTQAEQLIVSGFLNQVVESLGWPEIVQQLESMFAEKLLE